MQHFFVYLCLQYTFIMSRNICWYVVRFRLFFIFWKGALSAHARMHTHTHTLPLTYAHTHTHFNQNTNIQNIITNVWKLIKLNRSRNHWRWMRCGVADWRWWVIDIFYRSEVGFISYRRQWSHHSTRLKDIFFLSIRYYFHYLSSRCDCQSELPEGQIKNRLKTVKKIGWNRLIFINFYSQI